MLSAWFGEIGSSMIVGEWGRCVFPKIYSGAIERGLFLTHILGLFSLRIPAAAVSSSRSSEHLSCPHEVSVGGRDGTAVLKGCHIPHPCSLRDGDWIQVLKLTVLATRVDGTWGPGAMAVGR